MPKIFDIIAEQDSANDRMSTVSAIYVESGQKVEVGQHLFDLDSSKAVREINAPTFGILLHQLVAGVEVKAGSVVARIIEGGSEDAILVNETDGISETNTTELSHFSQAAQRLLSKLGLKTSEFHSSFVTEAMIIEYYNANPAGAFFESNANTHKPHKPHKIIEIDCLGRGPGNSWLSLVSASIARREFLRAGHGFFENKILDIVVFEASRLMRQFKSLNAKYEKNGATYYSAVNAGIALSGGDRLVVYKMENTDLADTENIRSLILNGIRRYARAQLQARELTGSTFTINDLTRGTLSSFLPLIPEGQSCLVGITKNEPNEYTLHIAFDHRLSDGDEASLFLEQLIDRIERQLEPHLLPPCCDFCGADSSRSTLGLVRLVRSSDRDKLCCAKCWYDKANGDIALDYES